MSNRAAFLSGFAAGITFLAAFFVTGYELERRWLERDA